MVDMRILLLALVLTGCSSAPVIDYQRTPGGFPAPWIRGEDAPRVIPKEIECTALRELLIEYGAAQLPVCD